MSYFGLIKLLGFDVGYAANKASHRVEEVAGLVESSHRGGKRPG